MDDLVKTNETSGLIPFKEVEDKIAIIRNQEVIADADVAALYGVETREVNQAVRNNIDKFPEHYVFELTKSELYDLKSKILISKVSDNNRKPTKVFTERGLYMLTWFKNWLQLFASRALEMPAPMMVQPVAVATSESMCAVSPDLQVLKSDCKSW